MDIHLVISGIICLAVLIDEGFFKHKHWINYSQAIRPLRLGFLILIISTICNSAVEGRWDLSYIISFLSLKKMKGIWFFRVFASFAYIYMLLGLEVLLIIKIKKHQSRKGV